jgi:hypothetical protein
MSKRFRVFVVIVATTLFFVYLIIRDSSSLTGNQVGSTPTAQSALSSPSQRRKVVRVSPTPFPRAPAEGSTERPPIKGQLRADQPFGRALRELSLRPDVNLFLETGTYYGGGLSFQIASALKEKGSGRLVTVESVLAAHNYASAFLLGYPVELHLGTAIDSASFPTVDEIKASGATFGSPESEWTHYLREEQKFAEACGAPILEKLCRDRDFDAVLIDGAEFTGPAEFEIVVAHCRPRFLALHDTNTFKGRHGMKNLSADTENWSEYEISMGDEDPTWGIWESRLN